MSMVGDVVFCVDCDLARSAQLNVAVGATTSTAEARPRRMATKKDANGDALCTACLDARLLRRRAAFVLHQAKSASTEAAASSPQPVASSTRRFSSVRIVRTRTQADVAHVPPAVEAPPEAPKKARSIAKAPEEASVVAAVAPVAPLAKEREKARLISKILEKASVVAKGREPTDDIIEALAEVFREATHAPNAADPELQIRFLQVAAEIGLVRARELLAELTSLALTERVR